MISLLLGSSQARLARAPAAAAAALSGALRSTSTSLGTAFSALTMSCRWAQLAQDTANPNQPAGERWRNRRERQL
eukprot:scaffold388634_cov31-Prasinocladus_malaysianus.AAC.1